MISHLILTFNKCKKYVCIYWSKTEKILIYDSKELNFFFFLKLCKYLVSTVDVSVSKASSS